MNGIIGKKIGMSHIYKEDGTVIPVTLIEAGPCCVVQVKTVERDGYEAVKLGFNELKKQKMINKALKGACDKSGVKPYGVFKEFSLDSAAKVGDMVTVDGFAAGDKVLISAVSKGKGFQGVMKRLNYSGGPGSHGSMFNRAPGSIGASSFPSRVWKNKGMPGHMGSVRISVKNVIIIDVKPQQNLLIIKGAVPGHKGTLVEVRKQL
ncbi:MAG: 50S ribosomal protein L3 [Nitrospirae bacterium]|nr:50S ribosomal protein L3 [Nitrospirota bacterium]